MTMFLKTSCYWGGVTSLLTVPQVSGTGIWPNVLIVAALSPSRFGVRRQTEYLEISTCSVLSIASLRSGLWSRHVA